MVELKKATTYDEQLDLLEKRGVVIDNPDFCKSVLENINYYRLMAYFLPFKQDDNTYIPGTNFNCVYRIYEFDRKLRRILFSALEEVEISIRAKFAYYHAHKYGPIGYLDASNFSAQHNKQKFDVEIQREIKSNSKALFVKHHLKKYEGVFPIWVITELFTFGMLSRFYADMKPEDRKYISRRIYGTTDTNVKSWLRCCSDLRNICAHYGRLYYRIFPAVPAGFDGIFSNAKLRRLWGSILALKCLFMDSKKWNNEFIPALSALIEEYTDCIDLYHLAFPNDWEEQLKK